jgi:hypothetical protein
MKESVLDRIKKVLKKVKVSGKPVAEPKMKLVYVKNRDGLH